MPHLETRPRREPAAGFSISRRRFGERLAGSLAAAWLPSALSGCAALAPPGVPPLLKPPRLRPKDLVGLIAPGGLVSEDEIARSIRNLEALGLRVKAGANLRAARGNYAGTVEQRLADLHAMFDDREVRAIWAIRGGSGCAALLPHIRYDLVRAHPKVLVGFSDITALHLALHRHAGLVTFHGPAAITAVSEYSVRHLRAVLMEPQPTYTIEMSMENRRRAQTAAHYAMRTLREGLAEGPLVGGNLSVVSALVGTAYAADFTGSLAFLEDAGEAPYRIDRMLTQLRQSGALEGAAAVMLGVFNRASVPAGEPSLSLEETFADHFGSSRVPAVYGYSFGHIADHFTIPVGVRARLDTQAQTLTLLEPAVSG